MLRFLGAGDPQVLRVPLCQWADTLNLVGSCISSALHLPGKARFLLHLPGEKPVFIVLGKLHSLRVAPEEGNGKPLLSTVIENLGKGHRELELT